MEHFFKVGWRLFKSEWLWNSVNVIGTSVGLMGIILLFVFVDSEISFDKFHKNWDKIYRITTIFIQDGKENRFAINEGLWDDVLVNDVPGVVNSTAFMSGGGTKFTVDGNSFPSVQGLMSDEDFLKVFDFEVISGSRDFVGKNDIIITEELARLFFGEVDVVGKVLETEFNGPIFLTVSAVIRTPPTNSSIPFTYVVSGKLLGEIWDQQFVKTNRQGNTLHIYFKTSTPQNVVDLQSNIDRAFSKHKDKISGFEYFSPVQPLADVHFNSKNQFELTAGGNKDYLKIFIFIIGGFAFIILVNSVNINTTQYIKRVKETGIRKLFGAGKLNLGGLFILDSMFTILLTTFIALFACSVVFLKYNLIDFSIDPHHLKVPTTIIKILFTVAVVGLLIGVFSCIRILSMKTMDSIAGRFVRRNEWFGARNVVVVIQIISASIMFSLSLMVVEQINYLNNKPLGYNKSNLLWWYKPETVSTESWNGFKNALARENSFSGVAGAMIPLLNDLSPAKFSINEHEFLASWFKVDADFMEVLEMDILQGREFTPGNDTTIFEAIINEAAQKELRNSVFLGEKIRTWFGAYEVVGVVKDFHFRGFNSKITPLVMVLHQDNGTLYARFNEGGQQNAIKAAERVWSRFVVDTPFEFQFFGDSFNRLIKRELQTRTISVLFATISLIVTAIGLVGLIGQMSIQFRQEIAIRKVLGSSVGQVLWLFGKRFAVLLIVGLSMAVPIVVVLSDNWLSNFEYKIGLQIGDFIFSAGFVILLTTAVISRQALAAAGSNPVTVLRNE